MIGVFFQINSFLPAALTLLALLLASGLCVVAAAILLMARAMLRPPRMTDGKALYVLKRLVPTDLEMAFEPVSFTVRDERTGRALRIASWWIPCSTPSGKTVVFIHGYADAKVGSIAWAPIWQRLGYHVLALDLRAHGESEGIYTTAGYFERHDVSQVIDQIRESHPRDSKQIVVFGISLGGAVALATADLREDVAAVVVDSPYADFRHALRGHAMLLSLPLPSLLPLAVSGAERLSGARFDDVRPIDLIARLKCPLMVIASGRDVFVPGKDSEAIEAAMRRREARSSFWKRQEVDHLFAAAADPSEYERRLREFLT